MKKLIITLSAAFMLLTTTATCQTNNDIELDEFLKKIGSEKYILIDVRTTEEFALGHIEGAINIDYYSPDFSNQVLKIGLDTPVLLYCQSGNRSRKSMGIMYEIGFVEVKSLDCGIKGWRAENRKIIKIENED